MTVAMFRWALSSLLHVLFLIMIPAHHQVFAALADNAKHNQTGRVDEHGALRHRQPELCGVGALAMLFFAHFHILCSPVPDFAPGFEEPNAGQYGVREWYQYHVFYPTRGSPVKEMTYASKRFTFWSLSFLFLNLPFSHFDFQDHLDRVQSIHKAAGVKLSKATHATRAYTAMTARVHGASVDGTKALGGWSDSGSFRPCYDRTLPVDALLGAATFDARKPESYILPRDALGTWCLPFQPLLQVFLFLIFGHRAPS
jgi:Centromere DNA-binding protein complex CBF3 subunit, domain 2